MKKLFVILSGIFIMQSCMVQQFPVNTAFKPFEEGGRLFGEKTSGKIFNKGYNWFVLGINVYDKKTTELAQEINANKYTVETRHTFWPYCLAGLTCGVVSYRIVKVIKRNS